MAEANATQKNPVNIAVQIIVNSPGASPVIVQSNSNSSSAHASNQSSTDPELACSPVRRGWRRR